MYWTYEIEQFAGNILQSKYNLEVLIESEEKNLLRYKNSNIAKADVIFSIEKRIEILKGIQTTINENVPYLFAQLTSQFEAGKKIGKETAEKEKRSYTTKYDKEAIRGANELKVIKKWNNLY